MLDEANNHENSEHEELMLEQTMQHRSSASAGLSKAPVRQLHKWTNKMAGFRYDWQKKKKKHIATMKLENMPCDGDRWDAFKAQITA